MWCEDAQCGTWLLTIYLYTGILRLIAIAPRTHIYPGQDYRGTKHDFQQAAALNLTRFGFQLSLDATLAKTESRGVIRSRMTAHEAQVTFRAGSESTSFHSRSRRLEQDRIILNLLLAVILIFCRDVIIVKHKLHTRVRVDAASL